MEKKVLHPGVAGGGTVDVGLVDDEEDLSFRDSLASRFTTSNCVARISLVLNSSRTKQRRTTRKNKDKPGSRKKNKKDSFIRSWGGGE